MELTRSQTESGEQAARDCYQTKLEPSIFFVRANCPSFQGLADYGTGGSGD